MSEERLEVTSRLIHEMIINLNAYGLINSKDVYNLHWLLAQAGRAEDLESEAEVLKAKLSISEDFIKNKHIPKVKELMQQNKRHRAAWEKAKKEAKEYGAGKPDEYIPDDDKEEAYRLGADDMYDDFVDE